MLTPRSTSSWSSSGSSKSKKSPRPSHHANGSGTAFKNPWPSAEPATWFELLQAKFPLGWYDDLARKHPGTQDVKVVVPDWGATSLSDRGLERGDCLVATWLGHAGAVVEIPLEGTAAAAAGQTSGDGTGRDEKKGKESLYVVFDPIFSLRAGPTPYTGPQRLRSTPCQVDDLPGCDAVVISHNHYDHLDSSTITAISKKFPRARYFLPLGNKAWLQSLGLPPDRVYELDWWQNRELSIQDFGRSTAPSDTTRGSDTLLRFTCVPAQHNSGRGTFDQGRTLWCGWVLEQLLLSKDEASPSRTRRRGAVYHAGDTGYRRSARSPAVCPVFRQIGARFGPLDLAFLPIWRGGTLGFISSLGLRLSHKDIPATFHASPADAMDIHGDVRSRNSVAVHFGTFIGSENESLEAIMEFEEAREQKGVQSLERVGGSLGAVEGSVGGSAVAEAAAEGKTDDDEERGRAGILDIGGSIAVEIGVHEAVQ